MVPYQCLSFEYNFDPQFISSDTTFKTYSDLTLDLELNPIPNGLEKADLDPNIVCTFP